MNSVPTGFLGHHRVKHHAGAGRNNRPQAGRRARDRRGEIVVKALILHGLQLDGADSAGIGQRAAGHAGENHAAEDVDMTQTAGDMPDQRVAEIKNARCHAAGVHNRAGQHEKNGIASMLNESPTAIISR